VRRLAVVLPGDPVETILYDDVAARLRAHGHAALVCGPHPFTPALAAADGRIRRIRVPITPP
jgi:hypothetical protein